MLRNSSCSRVRVIGSIAPNGSSISMTGGSAASARATPTRCRCPPDSSRGKRSRYCAGSMPTSASSSSTRRAMRASSQPQQARHRGDVLARSTSAGTGRSAGSRSRCCAAARTGSTVMTSRPATRDRAAVGLDHAVDHAHRRRLAAARRSDQHADLARGHGQRQAIDRRRAACRRSAWSARASSIMRARNPRGVSALLQAAEEQVGADRQQRRRDRADQQLRQRHHRDARGDEVAEPAAADVRREHGARHDLHRGGADAREDDRQSRSAARPCARSRARVMPMPRAASTMSGSTWRIAVQVLMRIGGSASSVSANSDGAKPVPSSGITSASTASEGSVRPMLASVIAASAARGLRGEPRRRPERRCAIAIASAAADSSTCAQSAAKNRSGWARMNCHASTNSMADAPVRAQHALEAREAQVGGDRERARGRARRSRSSARGRC